MSELLFVYGTLMHGRGNHRLLQKSRFLGPARAEGLALYRVCHAFPGAVEVPGETVLGEAYEVDAETLRAADRLEGNGSLYRRKKLPIVLESGERLEAWVYVWLHGVRPEDRVPLEMQPWGGAERPVPQLRAVAGAGGAVPGLPADGGNGSAGAGRPPGTPQRGPGADQRGVRNH